MPTSSAGKPRWAPVVVFFLILAWLSTMGWLVLQYLKVGLSAWPLSYQGTLTAAMQLHSIEQRSAVLVRWLAGVAVLGALLIALVAYIGRLVGAVKVFLILAVVLGALSVPVLAVFGRVGDSRHTGLPPASTPTPSVCVNRSGGAANCPGG